MLYVCCTADEDDDCCCCIPKEMALEVSLSLGSSWRVGARVEGGLALAGSCESETAPDSVVSLRASSPVQSNCGCCPYTSPASIVWISSTASL